VLVLGEQTGQYGRSSLLILILFLCAVLVLGEQAGQYGRGSLLVRLGQLGPLAVTAAQQITFGTGTKELLLKREKKIAKKKLTDTIKKNKEKDIFYVCSCKSIFMRPVRV
jgi:hypothetical protein